LPLSPNSASDHARPKNITKKSVQNLKGSEPSIQCAHKRCDNPEVLKRNGACPHHLPRNPVHALWTKLICAYLYVTSMTALPQPLQASNALTSDQHFQQASFSSKAARNNQLTGFRGKTRTQIGQSLLKRC
jgi:hypothetical protein